jgi:hypothetical protein
MNINGNHWGLLVLNFEKERVQIIESLGMRDEEREKTLVSICSNFYVLMDEHMIKLHMYIPIHCRWKAYSLALIIRPRKTGLNLRFHLTFATGEYYHIYKSRDKATGTLFISYINDAIQLLMLWYNVGVLHVRRS